MTSTVACDFCGSPNPPLRYPTRSHASAKRTGIDLGGGSWACERCAAHINSDAYDELLPHVTAQQQASTGRLPAEAVRTTPERRAQLVLMLFRTHRTGPPTRYIRKNNPMLPLEGEAT